MIQPSIVLAIATSFDFPEYAFRGIYLKVAENIMADISQGVCEAMRKL
jgi:hypothetical protein